MLERLFTKKGVAIVEVVLSIGLFAIFSSAIFYVTLDVMQGDEKIEENNKAMLYAQEGLEAARQMRDRNFLLLTSGDHGLQMQNNVWSFIQAPEDVDGYYSRTINVEDVYRDANGEIAVSGTLDPDIKKVTSVIEWNYRGVLPKNLELQTYLSNWRGDDWLATDCTEFEAGTFTDTETVSTVSPPDNNCAIKLSLEEEQSSFLASADVGEHGKDVVVDGDYAYLAVNKTTQGLAVVNIADKQNPVVIKQVDVGGKGLSVGKIGDYVYVGVESSSKGLAIVNATTPASATLVKQLNIGGHGSSIATNGSYVYVGVHYVPILGALLTVNVSNPTNPIITFLNITPGTIQDMKLVDSYLYTGMDYDWQGFRIFNVTVPSVPITAANLSLNEEVNAVETQGPYAFLGTEANSLYIVDISDVEHPSVVDELSVSDEIQDLAISGDYIYGAMDDNSANLIAINISDPINPYVVYTKDVGGKGSSIKAFGDYIYETILVNNKGLVISGATVVQNAISGDYISSALDTGSTDPKYNYLKWSAVEVPGSTVKLQIRTASTQDGLQTATWVGSDGTNTTYYENSGLPIVTDPGASGTRFFQFKIRIDSDGVHTPQIEAVTINYNP